MEFVKVKKEPEEEDFDGDLSDESNHTQQIQIKQVTVVNCEFDNKKIKREPVVDSQDIKKEITEEYDCGVYNGIEEQHNYQVSTKILIIPI